MKKEFRALPQAIKKQVAYRFWFGVLAALVFLFIVVFTRDIVLGLPCIFLSVYLFIDGGIILYHGVAKKYVVVRGFCTDIERTRLRKRIKAVYIQTGDKLVRIPVNGRRNRFAVGCKLALYMSDQTRVYERDSHFVVFSYYALDIVK